MGGILVVGFVLLIVGGGCGFCYLIGYFGC